MTKIVFKNTLFVGLMVLGICALLFFGMQYTQTVNQTYEILHQESVYAEWGVIMDGASYLEQLSGTDRIIWMDSEGSVLYDTESDDPSSGTIDQEVVRNVLRSGEGKGTVKFKNSDSSSLYYARQCGDGSILCFSRPVSAVRSALASASPVLWVLVLVILIASAFAFRASRQIVTPIDDLDLDHPKNNPYPELSPLLDKIEEQKLTIQEEASSREEMRKEFSANVSHELKAPLTSISGFAEKLSRGGVSEDIVEDFSKKIYKESQHLIALVDDIIKLSRLDEEAIVPKKDKVDLRALAIDVADSLRTVADRYNITFDIRGESVVIPGVYQLLYEMIYNLCDNAIKYNYPGGSVTIDISVTDDKKAVFSVIDTGIGIAKEHQKRVFERFYRVDKSNSSEIGGTGLGLSIVKHGAVLHNAEVELSSEEGVGTQVTLFFPYQTEKK